MALTKRQMYNMLTASTIAEDALCEFRDDELVVIAPKAPLPPAPKDPDEVPPTSSFFRPSAA